MCSVTPTLCDLMDCIARQALLSMEFPWQGYWSGLPFPSPGNLSDPGWNICLLWLLPCRWILYLLSHQGSLKKLCYKIIYQWNSLVIQWLVPHASSAGGMGCISDWGLRFCKPHCVAKLENALTYIHSYSSEVERTGETLESQQIFYSTKIKSQGNKIYTFFI